MRLYEIGSFRHRTVLFGGFIHNPDTRYADTWEWDGNTWAQMHPVKSPSKRSNHTMTFDSSRGKILLFGGCDGHPNWIDDTWEWDGVNWINLNPLQSPSRRGGTCVVYDSSRNKAVLFGGYDGITRFSDTWELAFPGNALLTGAGTGKIGTPVTFALSSPGDPSRPYQMGSSLGTGPIPIDVRSIGLSWDLLLFFSIYNMLPMVTKNYAGLLDANGGATPNPQFVIPNSTGWVGLRIYNAFLILDPKIFPSGVKSISNTCSFTILK